MSGRTVHTIIAGDVDSALVHGLTVKASCGLIFVPKHSRRPKGMADCASCAEVEERRRRTRLPRSEMPHLVYRHYDPAGVLLYIGCTVDPKGRLLNHKQNSWWFPLVATSRHTVYPNKLHARRIERTAIRDERPLCNVQHQDFRSWPPEQIRAGATLAVAAAAPSDVIKRFGDLLAVAS